MVDISYRIVSTNATVNDTMTVNTGDSLIVIGTYESANTAGVKSSSRDATNLIGDFPPEIPKNNTFWVSVGTAKHGCFTMRDSVILNTPGTYTFQKGLNGTARGILTVIVNKLAPDIPVNINGAWKNSNASVNVNGSWKEVSNAYVNVNGSWKEI